MQPLSIRIEPLAIDQINDDWLPGYKPYRYQMQVYNHVRRALKAKETLCMFITTPTGSGKTLSSYAYSIKHRIPAFGVYPTNELIRDQERALARMVSSDDLFRIDNQQLDEWQTKFELQRHSETLEKILHWNPIILTNPDILFYAFFGLYGGPENVSQRLFTLIGQYQIFIFDEFHLYNVKQVADVTYLLGSLHAINPKKGRVFIFASATPESPAIPWIKNSLNLPVEIVEGEASYDNNASIIAYPLELTIFPADLGHWKGVQALFDQLPVIKQHIDNYPNIRLVTILDSVVGAIELAKILREHFPDIDVAEVHGFSSEFERSRAIKQSFTVGTSTIEVGIDFFEEAEKDLLIFEARTATQFIQRLGRIARHEKSMQIPNFAIALVPEYVYHFIANQSLSSSISRKTLYQIITEAYQRPQDFAHYLGVHAAPEFQAARKKIQVLFQPDEQPRISKGLGEILRALTGKSYGQAWRMLHRYRDEEHILQPLLTFRGNGFEVGIIDKRGCDHGFPVKRYNLMFLLRRCIFTEIDQQEYLSQLDALADQWPEEVTREKRYCQPIGNKPEDLLGVYGYFIVNGLLEESRKVYFEVSENEVFGRKAQVTVINGLEIIAEPEIRLRYLNTSLRRKRIVAWFIDHHPASIKLGRSLPPLFELYELRIRRLGGGLSSAIWSIAFNQDAFFVDSLGWWQEQRKDTAIIL